MKGLKDIGQYKPLAASGSIVPAGGTLLRFICSTAGTLQITDTVLAGGTTIVASMPVAAGSIYAFGMDCPLGAWAVLGGGATGTFIS